MPSEALASNFERQYLTFLLGEYLLSTELANVSEIVEYPSTSSVPGSPNWVRGVFNLRGRVVPIIDLARKLGLEPAVVGKKTCILVLKLDVDGLQIDAGIVADEVRTLVVATDEEIEPPPVFGAGFQIEYLAGMLRPGGGDEVVAVVDLVAVFAKDELLAFALQEHRNREASSQNAVVASEQEIAAIKAGLETRQENLDEGWQEGSPDATTHYGTSEYEGTTQGLHFFEDDEDEEEEAAEQGEVAEDETE